MSAPQTVYPPQGTNLTPSTGASGAMMLLVVGNVQNPKMNTVLTLPTPTGPAVTMSTVLTTGVA